MESKEIKDIEYDHYKSRTGCPTCDYGSVYVDNMRLTYDDDSYIEFNSEVEDSSILTESDWMIMLANSKNENELIELWKKKVDDYLPSKDIYYTKGLTWSNESIKYFPYKGDGKGDNKSIF